MPVELLPHRCQAPAHIARTPNGEPLHRERDRPRASIVLERFEPCREQEIDDEFGSGLQDRLDDKQDRFLS
jgi:hypothetical protein